MSYNLVMMNDQDLWQKSSSSKLVMYDQHHHLQQLHHQVQHQHQAGTEFGNVGVGQRPKKPTRSVIPRLDLNLDPSILSVAPYTTSIQARKNRLTTTTTTSPKISQAKSHSLTNQQQQDYRAQSEVQLQFERQHAFEVSLEQMLVEVENGTECEKEEKHEKAENRKETKNEEKQKKVGKEAKNKEKSSPAWRKIWYKRQG